MSRSVLCTLVLLTCSAANAEPLKTPVVGPQRLCFKYSTFNLLVGERVADFSGGFERMSITIEGPAGRYEIAESEIFVPLARVGRLVLSHNSTHVYRARTWKPGYAIYGRTHFSPDQDLLVIWLSGSALKGSRKDAAIYSRFDVGPIDIAKCGSGFTYSWL